MINQLSSWYSPLGLRVLSVSWDLEVCIMALQWPCYNGKCRISEEREYRDWDIWADFMMGLSGEDSNKQRMKDTADTPWANTYMCDDDDAEEMIKSGMFWPHGKKWGIKHKNYPHFKISLGSFVSWMHRHVFIHMHINIYMCYSPNFLQLPKYTK